MESNKQISMVFPFVSIFTLSKFSQKIVIIKKKNGTLIQCQIVGPNLRDYSDFPEMMKVPENFCPK